MNTEKILNAAYIDILYDGKNKNYGGYELRKKYNKRAQIALFICIAMASAIISLHFLSFTEKNIPMKNDGLPTIIDSIVLLPPPDDIIESPKKLENIEPPKAPPTDAYTPPIVAPNDDVIETDVIQNIPTDKIPGPENFDGEPNDNTDLNPGLNGNGKLSIAANPIGDDEGNDVKVNVDRLPTPTVDVKAFIEKHLKYPHAAIANEVAGRVMLQFVVEKDGTISNIEIVNKKIGYGLEEEAIRIMRKIPPYIPGELNGKPVRVRYNQVIKFNISR